MAASSQSPLPCTVFRRLIELCALPTDVNLPPHRRFFPKGKLSALCTPDAVTEVLSCWCPSCTLHTQSARHLSLHGEDATTTAQLICAASSLVSTFCLFVYIKCPQLIRHVLCNNNPFTHDTPNNWSVDYIRRNAWPGFDDEMPHESTAFAHDFRWNKYNFFLPTMASQPFSEYESSAILPFVDEEPIWRKTETGETTQEHGAFGRNVPSTTVFARKELFATAPALFHLERQNLERVRRLNDPHLVRIIAAYKHGDHFNFIFPCAKTNLEVFLRDENYSALSCSTGRTELSPMWTQLLGIANALDKIINYRATELTENPQYGYHFDLKPANILIDESDTFIISDFGQARFQDAGGTSRITPIGGTEAYAPPEIDGPDCRHNRKYDVWSLGCIFLEVCTFLLRGHAGLKRLDQVRATRSRHNMVDDRFFYRCARRECYDVKSEIQDWMASLVQTDLSRSERSREFVREFLCLVKQMLQVNQAQRIASQQVCKVLKGIIHRYQSIPRPTIPSTGQPNICPNDIEYGHELTTQINTMLHHTADGWEQGPVRIVEDTAQAIIIVTLHGSETARLKLGPRPQTKVIARYASPQPRHQDYSDCHLYFSTAGADNSGFSPAKLYFRDSKDALRAHAVLMGQDIRSSLGLARLSICKRMPLKQRLTRSRPTTIDASAQSNNGAIAIQLWSEKSYADSSTRSKHGDSRRSGYSFRLAASHRRIVVYLEACILIVRLAKNVRIERRMDAGSSRLLRIIPTDAVRDSSFTSSLLVPAQGEFSAGIPLSKTCLEEQEEKCRFECTSLELTFTREDDLRAFRNSYRKLKDEWRSEVGEIERCRKQLGELMGYA